MTVSTVGGIFALSLVPAIASTIDFDFSFGPAGFGALSLTPGFGATDSRIPLTTATNVTYVFQINTLAIPSSSNTWSDQNSVLRPKYQSLELVESPDGSGWYWDDDAGNFDEDEIVSFDNGVAVLAFDEGDRGRRDYRVNGDKAGLYSISQAPPQPQKSIQEALDDVATTPNSLSTANVIAIACPAAIKNSRFATDCGELVGAALQNNEALNDQAGVALTEITVQQATVPLSSSRANFSTQLKNVSNRIAALRGGATGLSVTGLALTPDGYGTSLQEIAGIPSAIGLAGGAASADDPIIVFGDERLGAFVNASYNSGNQNATVNQDGFDFDGWGITTGIDYRFKENLILGLAAGYTKSTVDIDSNGGDLDIDSYNIGLYGTYFHGEGFYAEGNLTYIGNSYDQKRRVQYQIGNSLVGQTASADYDGQQWSGMLGAGYTLSNGPLSYGPVARIEYTDASVDGYRESMSNPSASGGAWATRIDDFDQDSLTSTLGADISYALSTNWGVVVPQLHASWVHQYRNSALNVTGAFLDDPTQSLFNIVSDKPDTDYFNTRLGVSAQMAGGVSAFFYYEKILGYRDLDLDAFGAGVRMLF